MAYNVNVTDKNIHFRVPDLDVDAGRKLLPSGRLERRIVAGFIHHAVRQGWTPVQVWDGEGHTSATSTQGVMELVFNLDEAVVYLKDRDLRKHWVYLVLGNGEDIISDYSFSPADGFNLVMDSFLDHVLPEIL